MKLVLNTGYLQPQFLEICNKALDKTQFVDVVTPSPPNTDFIVNHGLGYLPMGYLIIRATADVVVYDGSVAWTTEIMSLRVTRANIDIRLMVF